ncbi:hypothetical protein MOUN0_N09758 [Monosporozyma unispora]|nr:hypothetical protein C6P44_004832 [Kazachstania unispora]
MYNSNTPIPSTSSNATTSSARKIKRTKYTIYDDILGPSYELTGAIKSSRHKVYASSTIHSLEDLESNLVQKKNWLVYDITATIPYTSLGVSFDASQSELLETVKHIVSRIAATTSQKLILRSNNIVDGRLTSSLYICHQDKASRRNRGYKKPSYFKKYLCQSRYLFKFRRNYNFIQIVLKHSVPHETRPPKPPPEVFDHVANEEPDETTVKREEFMNDLLKIKTMITQVEEASDNLKDTLLGHPRVSLVKDFMTLLSEPALVGEWYVEGKMDGANTSGKPSHFSGTGTDCSRWQSYDSEEVMNMQNCN